MDAGRPCGKDVQRIRIHGYTRWWSRIHRLECALDLRAPWDDVYSLGVQEYICADVESLGGPRRYVFLQRFSGVCFDYYFWWIVQDRLGVQVHLLVEMGPVSPRRSSSRLQRSKGKASGRSFPDIRAFPFECSMYYGYRRPSERSKS